MSQADAPAEQSSLAPVPRGAGRGKRAKVPGTSEAASALMLDLDAVADVEGLAEEVAMLRASIRELVHPHGDLSEHVKILAELRHQVEALCSTLKAQQALEGERGERGRRGGISEADVAQTLDDLGDRLGVPR